MRVFLDDQKLTQTGDSIASGIAAAKAAALQAGRVVVDVLVDGERLDDDALSAPSDRDAGTVELRCVSADPRALVAESFAGVADALGQARQSQKLAAESLQTGKLDDAFNELQSALEVWDAVHRVTDQGPALLGVTLAALGKPGTSLDDDLVELSRTLAQVKEAVGGQDWSTLADLLSHELDDAAQRWGGLLNNMGSAARSVPAPTEGAA